MQCLFGRFILSAGVSKLKVDLKRLVVVENRAAVKTSIVSFMTAVELPTPSLQWIEDGR